MLIDPLNLGVLRPVQAMAASQLFKKKRLLLSLPRQYGGKTELGVRCLRDITGRPFDSSSLFMAKDHNSAKKATQEKFLRLFEKEVFSVNTEKVFLKKRPSSVIYMGSCDKDPDRMRGGTYSFVHWSEVAFAKIEKGESITDVFDKIIAPTLRIKGGFALLESTNNGKNGWYDLWENADDLGFAKLKVSLGMMVELGLLSQAEYDDVKRTTHPLVFEQEYECGWVTFAGAVYPELDEANHVWDFPGPKSWQRTNYAIDWGFDPSATCVLYAYVENGVLCIYDEHYAMRERTDETKRKMFIKKDQWKMDKVAGVADHEEDRIQELNLAGIACGPADKTNVLGARMQIKTMLWEGKIAIHPRCKWLRKDLSAIHWDKKKDGEVDYTACTWGHYDAEAALRYLVRMLGQFEEEKPDQAPQGNDASAREYHARKSNPYDGQPELLGGL